MTMKFKYSIFLLCVAAALPLSCVKERVEEPDRISPPEDGIVLSLSARSGVRVGLQSKAPNPPAGEAERNENNYGSTVDVFFFTDSTATAPIRKRKIAAEVSNDRVVIPTTPLEVKNIFGSTTPGAECYVLVIANYDGSYDSCETWGDIDNLLLPIARWSQGNPSKFVMTGAQKLILKSQTANTPATGAVGLERIAVKVSFELTVAASAQTSETTDVWEPLTTGMSVYMVYAMRQASLSGAPRQLPALAIGEKPVGYTTDLTDDTHYLYEYKALPLVDIGKRVYRTREGITAQEPLYVTGLKDGEDNLVDQEVPFYCYPSLWNMGASNEPYLKLIIPWNNGKRTKYYYYKIPFHGTTLERNNWYKISIDVQILGSEEPVPPPITVTYAIADWSGERDATETDTSTDASVIPATIIASRYLTVPTKEYVMYNTDELTIPITSSHNVEVVGFTVKSGAFSATETGSDANYIGHNPRIYNPFTETLLTAGNLRATHPDYSSATISPVTTSFTSGAAQSGYNWSVTTSRDAVVIKHALNRDMNDSDYDVAPWTLRLRVRHETDAEGNEDKYYQDVIIEQRPAIIIKPEPNSDTSSGGTAHYGYAFVNGAQGDHGTTNDGSWTGSSTTRDYFYSRARWSYYLGSPPSGLTGENTAASMYVIETSVLPTNGNIANYMLGDPRTSEVDNLGQTWSQSKTAWYGTSPRRLTYYYPASMDIAYNDFIAPKLRIASSYGVTYAMRFADARRRCASYQEDGYPAGRWRLPTKAEIEYIAQLNADNKIELLLGNKTSSTNYWCNSGYMTVQLGRNPSYTNTDLSYTTSNSVRCVYDDWYWGASENDRLSDTEKSTFTWGDQPRSSVTAKQ